MSLFELDQNLTELVHKMPDEWPAFKNLIQSNIDNGLFLGLVNLVQYGPISGQDKDIHTNLLVLHYILQNDRYAAFEDIFSMTDIVNNQHPKEFLNSLESMIYTPILEVDTTIYPE